VSVAAFFLLLGIYIIGAEVRVGVATALAEPLRAEQSESVREHLH
jgi:hypothetical protein